MRERERTRGRNCIPMAGIKCNVFNKITESSAAVFCRGGNYLASQTPRSGDKGRLAVEPEQIQNVHHSMRYAAAAEPPKIISRSCGERFFTARRISSAQFLYVVAERHTGQSDPNRMRLGPKASMALSI